MIPYVIARKYLPDEIVYRKKLGFRVPLDKWFQEDLGEMAGDLLLSSNSFVSTTMDRKIIQSVLESHLKGRRNEEIRIWTLLGLEIWHQVFFKEYSFSSN